MKTVLAVDDDSLITKTMQTLLGFSLDCKILTCNNPEEALTFPEVINGEVDVVLSDFMMPQMNGLEFFKKLKAISPNSLRILLTGYADKENAIACINEVGLYYYLQKPWDNAALINIVKNGFEKLDLTSEVDSKTAELLELNRTLEQRVNNRVSAVRNLLNNAGEGFLSIDKNFLVGEEYSFECLNIFGERIENKNFSELIYPDNKEKQELTDRTLLRIFEETVEPRREVYISMLPETFDIQDKIIEVKYKEIHPTPDSSEIAIMAILTDITEKVILQSCVEDERRKLRMVIGSITDTSSFFDNIEEYKNFCTVEIPNILSSGKTPEEMLSSIYIVIHTYKGIFALKHMGGISQNLHEFETALSDLKRDNPSFTMNDIKYLVDNCDMIKWLEEDLAIIKDILGEDFFSKEQVVEVKRMGIEELEKRISLLPESDEKTSLQYQIKRIQFVPFIKLVKSYEEYVYRLADKLEKMVNVFQIEGGKCLVDYNVYSGFTKSLVHILRNALEYGIETPDERVDNGKEEYGNLSFKIFEEDNNLVIAITDDGRGIDVEKVRSKAVSKGFMTPEEAVKLSREEVIPLIFRPELSTRDTVSEISGRGVGLAAVMDELKKLHGKVSIKTAPNEGTVFRFSLPLDIGTPTQTFNIDDVLFRLCKGASESLSNIIKKEVEFKRIDNYDLKSNNKVYSYSTLIHITGLFDGAMILSMDEKLAETIARNYIIDCPENIEKMLLDNAVCEATNMITASFINSLPGYHETNNFSIPLGFYAKEMFALLPRETKFESATIEGGGNILIGFVSYKISFS